LGVQGNVEYDPGNRARVLEQGAWEPGSCDPGMELAFYRAPSSAADAGHIRLAGTRTGPGVGWVFPPSKADLDKWWAVVAGKGARH